jgi:general secretion pathway protein G
MRLEALVPTRSRRRLNAGFTLLEIMLVVMIIALLAGAAIYTMGGANILFAQETRIRSDIQNISTELRLYQAMNGFFPSTGQGLQAMITQPDTEPRPTQWRQLFEKMPLDPWQSEYEYVQPGAHNPSSFDLFSKGPDRVANTADDIGNWSK